MQEYLKEAKFKEENRNDKELIEIPYYDVIIVGGGVIGSFISYQLSKYDMSICLLEKASDLAMEESGANSAIIHAGFDALPGTLKALYNIAGNEIMEEMCKELKVPYEKNGALVLAFTQEDIKNLSTLYERGIMNGVKDLKILTREEVLSMESTVSPSIEGALYAPTSGIVSPFELTLAASEVAFMNGVIYNFEHRVIEINKIDLPDYSPRGNKKGFEVTCEIPLYIESAKIFSDNTTNATTNQNENISDSEPNNIGECQIKKINCGFIVNAAGVFADKISNMAGDYSFTITPRKGEYMVMDKTMTNSVKHTLFQVPSDKGKGVLVTPTVEGNTLIGPNSQEIANRADDRTTTLGMEEIWKQALRSVPTLERKWMIRSFAGIRSTPSTHDFIIGESKFVEGFFQAAGIESPGLTSSPAIAQAIEKIILEAFLNKPQYKKLYLTFRPPCIRFSELEITEQQNLINKNPKYSQIICRCENITEAEIIDSINRPLGATTVNGVKLRTRAGMGRCQSGFCLPKILQILAREKNVAEESVTLFGSGSEIIKGRTRC